MTKHLALIVDDEADICELLELTMNRMDIDTYSANDLSTAFQLLKQHPFSICLTDMRLPDGNGLELVKHIKQHYEHIPVAMISAHGNMDTAIEALKSGAFDFVSKPVVLAELRNLINSAIKMAENEKRHQPDSTPPHVDNDKDINTILGSSAAIEKARQLIIKLSKSQAPVHINGESGTGKELAAKLIHQLGPRSQGPFIPINCGAIPGELMESEFFGHKKGSFTGAVKDKSGLFLSADGGTLFLDEVADLPLNMQVKLLRVIQEKAVRAIGDDKEKKIDVRIISATHKNLKQLVSEEKFRQDLFYRINVIEMKMPSLRGRKEDILELSEFFLQRLTRHGKPVSLSGEAINAMQQYTFPGNVRELENILERAITLCEDNIISEFDLNLPEKSLETTITHKDDADEPLLHIDSGTSAAVADSHDRPNKDKIIRTLDSTRWNRKAAASLLGITYRQLRYRLKKLGLE